MNHYFIGLDGFPNLFFLHSVWPKKRPINALASVVWLRFPNSYNKIMIITFIIFYNNMISQVNTDLSLSSISSSWSLLKSFSNTLQSNKYQTYLLIIQDEFDCKSISILAKTNTVTAERATYINYSQRCWI